MSENKKNKLEVTLKNIGPYENSSFECEFDKTKMAIYADNGSGKTYFSRAFAYYQESAFLVEKDEEPLIDDMLDLISFGKDKGRYSLKFTNKVGDTFDTEVSISQDNLELGKHKGLIYHVFNSEYIKNNFEIATSKPDSVVDSYIVGKSDIDVDKEKRNVDNKEKQIIAIKEKILEKIADTKDILKNQDIPRNINEYKLFDYECLLNKEREDEARSPAEIEALLKKLSKMPDDFTIEKLSEVEIIAKEEITNSNSIICPKYDVKSKLDKFKKEKFNEKHLLIIEGVKISDGEICPFCGQTYSESALQLLEEYTVYIEDEDSLIRQNIEIEIKKLENAKKRLDLLTKEYNASSKNFDKLKGFVPSFSETELNELKCEEIKEIIDNIIVKANEKQTNLGLEIDTEDFSILNSKLLELMITVKDINSKIEKITKIQLSSTSERLSLRKAFCRALFNKLKDDTKTDFAELEKSETELKSAKEDLEKKLKTARIDRKKLVKNDFKNYLDLFFAGKYVYDEKTGCLKFNDNQVRNAEKTLSDGEKGIVAFCHYMASIAKYVTDIKDYDKILFIIDDPVSSMDFNYVYAVAQMIKNIGNYEYMRGKQIRYIVLTHNMEFMRILLQNRVVEKGLMLSKGKFNELDKGSAYVPYTAHLKSVYDGSKGEFCCRHTIPNSIRNIIETIMRFEKEIDDLMRFVLDDEILSTCGDIHSMMNDLSHGQLGDVNVYPESKLIEACKTTIDFVQNRYPGQIKGLEEL